MSIIFLRTLIIFIVLLIIMRLMGKRQIGEMQPFELVITLIIADLACFPMSESSIPLMYGIIAIITIFLLHQLVVVIDLKAKPLKRLISGKPSIVVNKNGIDYSQLKSNNLDVSDVIESMRTAGYFSLDDIEYGIYEANGSFSALERQSGEKGAPSLPVLIMSQGKFEDKNVTYSGFDVNYFKKYFEKKRVRQKDVLVLTLDGNGKIYFQPKGKRYQIDNISLPEGVKW